MAAIVSNNPSINKVNNVISEEKKDETDTRSADKALINLGGRRKQAKPKKNGEFEI